MPLEYLPDLSSFSKDTNADAETPKHHGDASKEQESKESEDCREKLFLYKIITDRYREIIEEKERKTITAMKELVNYSSPIIEEIANWIKGRVEERNNGAEFLPDRDLKTAIDEIVIYASNFKKVKFPITFWLTFEDMMKYKIGDDIDIAVLMCSVFRSFGYESMVVVSEDRGIHVTVKDAAIKETEKYILISKEGVLKEGLKEDLVKEYKLHYGFSDTVYEDYKEED